LWKGEIRADFSEDYTFYVAYDNGASITINGSMVFDGRGLTCSASGCACCVFGASTPFSMTAGEWIDIEVFFANHWNENHFIVEWESASQPREVIPASAFRTAAP